MQQAVEKRKQKKPSRKPTRKRAVQMNHEAQDLREIEPIFTLYSPAPARTVSSSSHQMPAISPGRLNDPVPRFPGWAPTDRAERQVGKEKRRAVLLVDDQEEVVEMVCSCAFLFVRFFRKDT